MLTGTQSTPLDRGQADGLLSRSNEESPLTDKQQTAATPERWTVVIPAFNEARFIARTLDTLAAQSIGTPSIVVVDNASTDGTAEVVARFAAEHPGLDVRVVPEPRQGRLYALETGIAQVTTAYVALCDADTLYPVDYLARAGAGFDAHPDAAAVFALGVYRGSSPLRARLVRLKGAIAGRLLRNQGHTGGYGQCFHMGRLRAAGGYSVDLWPFMVADHEVVNRVRRHGRIVYSGNFWCLTSDRRKDRSRVDWSLGERLLYNFSPGFTKDWFFYRFLRPRFEKRTMYNINLRSRDWEGDPAP
ncbi:hypothetical protein CKO24_01665 [Rhodothalassium salexigens DSM 2132]|nr:hypothetical protein [Rhodothalassium salexigens DSM 2132]